MKDNFLIGVLTGFGFAASMYLIFGYMPKPTCQDTVIQYRLNAHCPKPDMTMGYPSDGMLVCRCK